MKLKKLLCATLLATAIPTYATDLSIVIDDSAGMCGYLAAPNDQNVYKKSLMKLLQAQDATSLKVNAYFLSKLDQPLAVGTAIDRVLQGSATQCPFSAVDSPLHQAVDLKKLKARSVVLISDLLFDEGSAGGSHSRSQFVAAFDGLAKSNQGSSAKWFTNSAGIFSLKAPFQGAYYSVHGNATQKLNIASLERPLYVVWLSDDSRFSSFLNQMTYLWQAPNFSNKKLAIEGAFAVRLLPTTEIISAREGLYRGLISPSLANAAQLPTPQIFYAPSRVRALDEIMPVTSSGEYPIVKECFKNTENPLHIKFDSACAKGGANEQALFKAEKAPDSVVINYPLNNHFSAIQRNFEITTSTQGFTNKAQAFYRTTASSHFYKANSHKRFNANVVFYIKGLKGQKSFVDNSPQVQNKTLELQVFEKFSAHPQAVASISKVANQYWSSEQEPCLEKTSVCKTATATTYMLDNLLQSLTTRLNANQKTAELLNAQYRQPTNLTISYK